MHVWFNPKILQGKKIIEDPVTHQPVPQEKLQEAFESCRELLLLLYDIDAGIIHLTLKEYKKLTTAFKTSLRQYRTMKAEYQNPER